MHPLSHILALHLHLLGFKKEKKNINKKNGETPMGITYLAQRVFRSVSECVLG